MVNLRMLRYDESPAVELTARLKQGDVGRLSRLLASSPLLACSIVEDAKGGGRSPPHLFADWPGHNPNPGAIVRVLAAAGADPDAPAVGFDRRRLTAVLRGRLRAVGGSAATRRAWRKDAPLARGGVGLGGTAHATVRGRATSWSRTLRGAPERLPRRPTCNRRMASHAWCRPELAGSVVGAEALDIARVQIALVTPS
jgi:hypothetical protein